MSLGLRAVIAAVLRPVFIALDSRAATACGALRLLLAVGLRLQRQRSENVHDDALFALTDAQPAYVPSTST